jgi:hypothetical protein
LIRWRCVGKEKLLLATAHRLVRIQDTRKPIFSEDQKNFCGAYPPQVQHLTVSVQPRGRGDFCAAARQSRLDVRSESSTDLTTPKSDFRFTPESGLKTDIAPCPFGANSGSGPLLDHLVSTGEEPGRPSRSITTETLTKTVDQLDQHYKCYVCNLGIRPDTRRMVFASRIGGRDIVRDSYLCIAV